MSVISKYECAELLRCYGDVHYFIMNYIKIHNPSKGMVLFNLYNYQKDVIDIYEKNTFSIGLLSRQMGITSMTTAYMLWNMIFKQDFYIATISNRLVHSEELIRRFLDMVDCLPDFLKPKITVKNKKEIRFDNGSGLFALTTNSPNSVRGRTLNLIFFDDFAFGHQAKTEEMLQCLIPCTPPGSKIIITSTPSGMDTVFYKLWNAAVDKKNGYIPFMVKWDKHPDRDTSFRDIMVKTIGLERFSQEYDCSFVNTI